MRKPPEPGFDVVSPQPDVFEDPDKVLLDEDFDELPTDESYRDFNFPVEEY